MNPIKKIPDDELTLKLLEKGRKKSEAEREWILAEHRRQIILSEIKLELMCEGTTLTVSKAEAMARTDKRYRDFVTEMGQLKADVILARVEYDVVQDEIKMRIHKSFQDRQEFKSGELVT